MKKKILAICSIAVMSFGVLTSSAVAANQCPPHHADSGLNCGEEQVYSFTHSYVEYVDAKGNQHNGICTVRVYNERYAYYCRDCGDYLYSVLSGQRYEHSNCGQQ